MSNAIAHNSGERRSWSLAEVFVPRAVPTVTFVDRKTREEVRKLRKEIMAGGVVNYHGDSRSGKTVSCLHVVRTALGAGVEPAYVHGREFRSEDEFWDVLGDQLAVGQITIVRNVTTKADERQKEGGLDVNLVGVRVGAGGARVRREEEVADLQTYRRRNMADVLKEWRTSGRPVVIDDFHDVDPTVQAAIAFRSKAAVDLGARLIVISIPEQINQVAAFMEAKNQTLGRKVECESPLWTDEEIAEIAHLGFRALNVSVVSEVIAAFVRSAYKSPQLMQLFCFNLCFDKDVEHTQEGPAPIPLDATLTDAEAVIAHVAKTNRADFIEVARRGEKNLKLYKLQNGNNVNIYELTMLSLAGIGINAPVTFKRLRERAQNLLARGEKLADAEITKAVQSIRDHMQAGREREQTHDIGLDLNEKYAYIKHPFFKLFLHGYLVPDCNKQPAIGSSH